MKNTKDKILIFLPYLLILSATVTLSYQKNLLPQIVSENLINLVYALFFISFVLALKFRRSRAFFILILIFATFIIFEQNELIEEEIKFFQSYSKTFLSIMIPLNIALFIFFKERGFFTLRGVARVLFIALQFLLLVFIAYYQKSVFIDTLYIEIIPSHFTELVALSDISLIVLFVALFATLIKMGYMKNHLDFAFFITISTTQIAINFSDNSEISSLFFIASSLVIIVSLLWESRYLAYYDELTAIPARRALFEHFEKLGNKYSVAMIDIDHFKKFNDTHGHDIGDEVLKLVAAKLSTISGGAKVYRFGGEEFTVVFANKAMDKAFLHLDKIREVISKTPYILRKKETKAKKTLFVTISIGVAEKNKKFKTPKDVLKQADNALYKAKKAGRNKVCN